MLTDMRRILTLLVVMFGLVACSSSGGQESLSPQEFQSLTAQPGVVTLDVRTPSEFASGHLEGAINIDAQSPDFETRIGELDPEATYAVYCRTANRSKAAMETMAGAGFTNLKELDGGIVAWQRQGLPVTTN